MTDTPPSAQVLERLADVIESRRSADPERSYVARLLARAPDAVLKKIGEEATETVMAAKDGDPARIIAETADLWFHCLVMLAQHDLRPEAVLAELARREGLSGLDEKALRKALERSRDEASGEEPGGLARLVDSRTLSSHDPLSRKP
jgi:phosphoribosyl-ATP pyrophosphohydrolase